MKIIQENESNIKNIVVALKDGVVLVLPTDTVYGLVCDATNIEAVKKIYKIKKRDKTKPLPVFVRDIKMAKKYAVIDEKQEKFLNENWPGAITVVLKGKKGLSPLVYKDGTIALRQPNYKLIAEVMAMLKRPLAQTSVNISNQPPLSNAQEIEKVLGCEKYQPDLIVDIGNLPKGKPSTIIDLTSDIIKILRT